MNVLGVLAAAAIGASLCYGALFPHGNESLRKRCDSHGKVFRELRDGGLLIAVKCNDGSEFTDD